jgi:hypothetical protein
MRYAVSGETYIIPLFFSLLASLCALHYNSRIWLTGLLASIACLFHQIHFFWWAGLFVYILITNKERRCYAFFVYSLVSCIVPAVYLLVYYLTPNDASGFFDFIFYDYFHRSGVSFNIGLRSLYLTPVSLVRTFFQVHGYIVPLVMKHRILLLSAGAVVALLAFPVFKCKSLFRRADVTSVEKKFGICHLLIFALQLLFAAGSAGNAEFMVMLPFALLLFCASRFRISVCYVPVAAGLFIWNLSFAVIPFHCLEMTPDKAVVRYIEQHPDRTYCLFDRQTAESTLRYRNPASVFHLYKGIDSLHPLLDRGVAVTTDFWSPRHLSRSTILNDNKQVLPASVLINQDSIPYDLGTLILSTIQIIM